MARFSIITVCKNEKKFIEQTILSVINQSFKDFEFIIVDGVSTDGTLDIIEKYKAKIDVFVSEKDNGIYEAMNKGIKLSSGDYLCFINANDFLYDSEVLANITKIIDLNPEAEFIFGEGVMIDPKTLLEEPILSQRDIKYGYDFIRRKGFLNHQSIFYKKTLFEKLGLYSIKYKIVSDTDFNLNCVLKNRCKLLYTDFKLSRRTSGGLAFCDTKTLKKEIKELYFKYFPIYSRFHFIVGIIKYFFPKLYIIIDKLFMKKAYENSKLNFVGKD